MKRISKAVPLASWFTSHEFNTFIDF